LVGNYRLAGKAEKENLIGDCFLSCACISYYGGFTGTYRDMLIAQWLAQAAALHIPASGTEFSLSNTLGDPVQIREWQNQGLPSDAVSVSNGILVSRMSPLASYDRPSAAGQQVDP